jgi:hypothetical protein
MIVGRSGATASLLNSGKVLIAGGYNVSSQDAELYTPAVLVPVSAWQQVITAMKAGAGTDSLNFWWWAYYWQSLPVFQDAPAGFGVANSISPAVMEQIIQAGGGDGFKQVSAEQWLMFYRQAASQ